MFENLSSDEKRQLGRIAMNAATLAAHIEATALIAEQLIDEVELITGCMHPMESRQDITTMGGAREFICKRCKMIISETDSPEFFIPETRLGG